MFENREEEVLVEEVAEDTVEEQKQEAFVEDWENFIEQEVQPPKPEVKSQPSQLHQKRDLP